MARFLALIGSFGAVRANIDFKRVHLVDAVGDNLLFRGNMPVNDTDFALDQMLSMMRNRAEEGGVTFPEDHRLVVVTLNNIVDYDSKETHFWDHASSDFGELVKWPIGFQGIVSPHDLSSSVRKAMCSTGITAIDDLDKHSRSLASMLQASSPTVVYVHCTAGCDRTGEMVAAYRIINGDFRAGRPSADTARNISDIYASDVAECGRPPNYFSSTALKWYCLCHSYKGMSFVGYEGIDDICIHFASCDTFGDCTPVGPKADALV